MAPVEVPQDKLHEFVDFDAFYAWLRANHDSADEVWIRIFKKASGKPTISPVEAIQAVLDRRHQEKLGRGELRPALLPAPSQIGVEPDQPRSCRPPDRARSDD